jgi:outer membrane lipase/esterase
MQQFKLRQFAAAALLAVGALSGQLAAAAAPGFSNVFFFGDSLSDTGNTQLLLANVPPPFGPIIVPDPAYPYDGGRFSNGPIWTEYLAAGLGFAGAASPVLTGGNNFSFAGARTGGLPSLTSPIPSVNYQTENIWAMIPAPADPNALYVVVAGGNDMRDARDLAPGTDALNQGYRQIAAEAAIANLKSSLGLLAQRGAKNVLVSNLPDLGATPEAYFIENFGIPGVTGPVPGLMAASTDATGRFNALMPQLLNYGASVGLTVSFLDMAAVTKDVRDNPGAYDILNTTLPCEGFQGSGTASCDVSMFSDALHPSSRGHQIIADAAFQALGVTPVPEPETVALMLAGLVMVGSAARRRSRNAA